jgi:octaprenyl-diphosphate synthase
MSSLSALLESASAPKNPPPGFLDELVAPYRSSLDSMQALYRNILTESESEISSGRAIDGIISSMLERGLQSSTLQRMTQHLVASEGKWLRGILVLLSARAFGVKGSDVDKAGATIELIHASTLIHDDIIDQSEHRRGLKTHAALWGNRLAVLLGDYVFARATQLTNEVANRDFSGIISKTANLLCRGEIQQQASLADLDLSETAYMDIVQYKTGALMSACLESPAMLAGYSDADRESCARMGLHLGIAFQIVDDMLDYSADSGTLGKTVLEDLGNLNITLPLIHLFRVSPGSKQLLNTDNGEVQADELLRSLESEGSLRYCDEVAREHLAGAHRCWQELRPHAKDELAWTHLDRLIDFIVQRDH